MKKSELRKMIKEELKAALNEDVIYFKNKRTGWVINVDHPTGGIQKYKKELGPNWEETDENDTFLGNVIGKLIHPKH